MARGLTQDDVASLSRALAEDLRLPSLSGLMPTTRMTCSCTARSSSSVIGAGLMLVEVHRTELTPVGLRREAIRFAGQMARDQIEFTGGYTADELVQSARTIETYLSGGFIPSELPQDEKQEDQS